MGIVSMTWRCWILGCSVAVANAYHWVSQKQNILHHSNNEDGVARALVKLVLRSAETISRERQFSGWWLIAGQ